MIHGIINIYKEQGFTSHDVVAKLRGILGQKKIGHTGTLDPDAVGVLPVCLGKATKLCDMLTDKDKTYETVLLLGKKTDTQDISGTVLEEKDTSSLTEEMLRNCVQQFIGDIMQIPPMYSALKVNGKKLYEFARAGIEIERKARPVTIHEIEILEVALPRVRMRISCSKGTYIRTICNDIGEVLGCGGCMEELTRTKVSRFEIAESLTLAEVQQAKADGRLDDVIVPIDAMFAAYKKVTLKAEFAPFVYNGNFFLAKHLCESDVWQDDEWVRVYDESGRFLAIYHYDGKTKSFRIEKMFYSKDE